MAGTTSCDRAADGWAAYYEKTGGRPPRGTLTAALDRFDSEGRPAGACAVDLGCGSGRDTVEILRRGWPVLAADPAPEALEALRVREDLPAGARLDTVLASHQDVSLPRCDLVNASFSLPLCPRAAFPAVWEKIVAALRPGGRFAGQLYGDRDSWAGDPGMTHLRRSEAEALLAGLEVEVFEEEEEDSTTPRGRRKHWHVFHVVARKPRRTGAPPRGSAPKPRPARAS